VRRLLLVLVILPLLSAAFPSASARPLSQPAGIRVAEPGFVVTVFSETGGTPSSLAFGPDTREGADGTRLYVADNVGNQILVIDDLGGVGSDPQVYADGFRGPLGVLAAPDGSLFVADAEAAREGPWGLRAYGRVWKVQDTDGDGTGDKKTVVLKDLPNGRHNTNGMAFGPDGMLYITNGNSTDDGIEGGEAEVVPWGGSLVKVDPNAKNVSAADLNPRKAVVAHGWRNVYDVAFSPVDPSKAFIPMNGIDDARKGSTGENPADPNLEDSDDLLFMTDVDDRGIDDFGYPSCLYNIVEKGDLKPYDNPNPDVIKKFGGCDERKVPRPVSSFGLHTSSDGLEFQRTDSWGEDYLNDLFVAEWGNLFGAPAGHDVVRVQLDKSGTKVESQEVFLYGPVPLDVTFDAAGVMYVADFGGSILRVDQVP
jgi:glucose/arabinose dehydrogenase